MKHYARTLPLNANWGLFRAPQSYIFAILWNKAELIHRSQLLEGCIHCTHNCLNPVPVSAPSTLMDQYTNDLEEEAELQERGFI